MGTSSAMLSMEVARNQRKPQRGLRFSCVGPRGFEPPTSSVSGKRSPPELTARTGGSLQLPTEVGEATPGIEPGYEVLQTSA